jgi:glycerol kinase
MKHLLALDQGTTSSRAIVFDTNGNIRAMAQQEFRQIFPQPAWVEHDANEIWHTQREVMEQAIAKASLKPQDIAAIGITNQRETTVVWDRKTGEPIANAIVWQDRRTAGFCAELKERGHESMVQRKTGLVLDPYFSGTKLNWLLDNVPDARARAERGKLAFGTVDTWLLWKLTNGAVHATDVSNASRTLLMNLETCEWDEELCTLLDVPRSVLPEIRSSSGHFGECTLPCAKGVSIAGIAGDQQAALFGQCCFEAGMAKNTYGTGSFLLMNTGEKIVHSKNRLLTTVAWRIGGRTHYALEGSVFISGALIQWLRDGLGIIEKSSDVQALAASVPDSGGVCLVPAFSGLGAPHWDPNARGLMIGMTRGTTKAHIARAAVEAMALQSCEVLDAMHEDANLDLMELRVDGGASRDDLLMQIQSNLLQRPVVRPRVTETTALGAALLAGLGVGVYRSREDVSAHWQMENRFTPSVSASDIAPLKQRWQRAVERAKQWSDD